MSWITALLNWYRCLCGDHAWNWKYATQGDCRQIRVCQHCGTTEQRTKHTWQEWDYQQPDSCAIERICGRCGVSQQDEAEHEWGSWQAWRRFSDEHCMQIRTCLRCSHIDTHYDTHEWNDPIYRADNSCALVQVCSRCQASISAGIAEHIWGAPFYRAEGFCETQRPCTRCGVYEAPVSADHKWDVWTYASPSSCQYVRYCRRCHVRQNGLSMHTWSSWRYDVDLFAKVRSCTRCGEQDRAPEEEDVVSEDQE